MAGMSPRNFLSAIRSTNTKMTGGDPPMTSSSRRDFLNNFGLGIGAVALADLLNPTIVQAAGRQGVLKQLHHAPKAKRVIFLFMSGAPSQLDDPVRCFSSA